jgi:hypothetical protein
MSEPSTSPEPPPTTKKRPTRIQRTKPSYADAGADDFVSDGDHYGPTDENEAEESPKKKKKGNVGKAAAKRAFLSKKVVHPTAPSLSRLTTKLNPPREPAIELSPATTNLNFFYKNLHCFSIN